MYKLVKFHDVEKKVRALIISKLKHNNNHDEKLRVTHKYLKLNRWVGVPNKHCFELYEVLEFMSAVEAAGVDDVRIVGSNDGYLENTFSILFADDLVDCTEDFGVPQDLSDAEWFKIWQPKALEYIVEEMLQDIGHEHVTVRESMSYNLFFKKRNLNMVY